ncbi:hypothetical protein PUN28_006064 [Cardiocondyla obscurior]|uniref:Uncharacterized protein n=1 Tax=Cardiocondyla obscurior TaxID=286306 RepID=A0AAW2GBW1_9HYME
MLDFNNYHLKKWLHGDKARRHRLLIKLKNDVQRISLDKETMRIRLIQLTIKPYVTLSRLSVCRIGRTKGDTEAGDLAALGDEKRRGN